MLYTQNYVFEAITCAIVFHNQGRYVHLHFEDKLQEIIIRATEADMAALTGKFLKERLFGLH